MKTLSGALLAALLWLPAQALAKDEPLDLSKPLPIDERITIRETLPNGMRVWIRPHKQPAGKVSMTLHFAAGSLHEADDQQGLAHYLEHMALNGSVHFPPGTLVERFEAIGGQFGRDVNAMTSFDVVAYILNLPNAEQKTIDLGLLYFSDVAQGLLLTPEEIDKERGVILEELRSRDAPGMRVMKKGIKILAPGSLVSQRLPGGIEEVITKAKRPAFEAYYRKWYRSDLATLMVVGDVDAQAIANSIRERFKDWKKPEAPVAHPASGIVPIKELRTAVITDPDLTSASGSFAHVIDPRKRTTIGDMRAMTVERLAAYVAQQRLTRRKQEGNAKYQDAQIIVMPFVAGARVAMANVESETNYWFPAQTALLEEIRRLHQHGVLESELAKAKTAFLTGAEQSVASAGSAPASSILMGWVQRMGHRSGPMSPTQSLDQMKKILPTITTQDVHARFQELFPLDRGVLSVSMPPEATTDADEKSLRSLAQKIAKTDLPPPAEEAAVGKLLAKAPKPGTVVSETQHEKLGVTRLALSNGAVVLVKPMPEAKVVNATVRLYGGLLDETPANRGITALAALSMNGERAATKRHTPRQISEYLNDKKVGVGLSRGDISAAVSIAGPPDDLEAGFELTHVLLSEPRIDPKSFEAAKRELVTMLQGARKQTGAQVMTAMRGARTGDDFRFGFPPIETVESITLEAAQGWLEQVVRGPMQILFAGKITVEEAKRLATTYLGSLPDRARSWETLRDQRVLKIAKGPVEREVVVDTASPAAIVVAGYAGVGKAEPALRARLVQAGFMLNSRLTADIREERGLTYTIASQYVTAPYDGLDQLAMQFTADPAKAAEAAKIARQQFIDFREKGPTPQEVTSAQMMLKAGLTAQMQMPQFWVQALGHATLEPSGLDGAAAFLDEIFQVDAEKVKAAVQSVIQPGRFVQVIGRPGTATGDK